MGHRRDNDNDLDPRQDILVETCTLCRRPRTACTPSAAPVAVCRRCALGTLPRLIAQAALADAESGRPFQDAMEASAVLRENYCDAVVLYSRYYDNLYGREGMLHVFWEGPAGDEEGRAALAEFAALDHHDDDDLGPCDDEDEEEDEDDEAEYEAMCARNEQYRRLASGGTPPGPGVP